MSYVRQQRMKKVQIDCTGHFWMHLSAMKNEYCCRDIFLVMFWILASLPQIQVRIIQKVVKRINVFTHSTFYILHLAYTFVMLLHKLIILLGHSVIFPL